MTLWRLLTVLALLGFAAANIIFEFDRPSPFTTTRPGTSFQLKAGVAPDGEPAVVARFLLNMEAPFVVTKIFPEDLSAKNCSIQMLENRVQHIECHVMNVNENVTLSFEVLNTFSPSSYGGRDSISTWNSFLGFAQGGSDKVYSLSSRFLLGAETGADPKISIYWTRVEPVRTGDAITLDPSINVKPLNETISIDITMKVPEDLRIHSIQSPFCAIQEDGHSARCSFPTVSSGATLHLPAQIYVPSTSSIGGKGIEIVAASGAYATRSIVYLNVVSQTSSALPILCGVENSVISSATGGPVSFNASITSGFEGYPLIDNVLSIFVPQGLKVVSVTKVQGGSQMCVITPSHFYGTDIFCSVEQLQSNVVHSYLVNTIVVDDNQYKVLKPLVNCWGSMASTNVRVAYSDFGVLVDNSKPTILPYSWVIQIIGWYDKSASTPSSYRVTSLITYYGPKPSTNVVYELKVPLLNGWLRLLEVTTSWGSCQVQASTVQIGKEQFKIVLCKLTKLPRIQGNFVGISKQKVELLVQFTGPQQQAPIGCTVIGTIIDEDKRGYSMAGTFVVYAQAPESYVEVQRTLPSTDDAKKFE